LNESSNSSSIIFSRRENVIKKYRRSIFLSICIIFLATAGWSQYSVDVHNNVPLYGQQQCCWCGAACSQMIMDGYPNPADRLWFSQLQIWNTIQANNSTAPADMTAGWCTDPLGLQQTLIALNPPPSGTWSIHANANRNTVMFDILYWINRNNYPVATLINQGGHWVDIVGFQTDIAPVAGSNPVLQTIRIHDPEPHNVGTDTTMNAAVWYATSWNGGIAVAGTWNNMYVAVIEPPIEKGKIRVEEVKRIGETVISPKAAVESAKKGIEKMGLARKDAYAVLLKKGILNQEPILVREEIKFGLEKEKLVPHYYIVPFGFVYETGKCGIPLTRISVIVNAFTGEFEEITAFGEPVRYLPQREAVAIIASALKLDREQLRDAKASVLFRPSDITHIRTYPFWKIIVGEKILYVDQLGNLYVQIKPSVPGD
jgi:hypothetical protein